MILRDLRVLHGLSPINAGHNKIRHGTVLQFCGACDEGVKTGRVTALLRDLSTDHTVVLIEHDMDIALSLARSITVMYYGQVIAEGDRASITAHPRVREVYFAD